MSWPRVVVRYAQLSRARHVVLLDPTSARQVGGAMWSPADAGQGDVHALMTIGVADAAGRVRELTNIVGGGA